VDAALGHEELHGRCRVTHSRRVAVHHLRLAIFLLNDADAKTAVRLDGIKCKDDPFSKKYA
jgi:hypothetical protein